MKIFYYSEFTKYYFKSKEKKDSSSSFTLLKSFKTTCLKLASLALELHQKTLKQFQLIQKTFAKMDSLFLLTFYCIVTEYVRKIRKNSL